MAPNPRAEPDRPPGDLDRCPVAGRGAEGVPVIDIAPLLADPAAPGARPAIREMAEACGDWGFFQVVNHGIAEPQVQAACARMTEFFARPRADKEAVIRTRENPWGYYHNELTKNQRDKKEVFDFTSDGPDPIYGAANRWPADAPGFRRDLRAFRDACTALARRLLQALCAGLDLPPGQLDADFADDHTGFMRLNYYPVADPLAGSAIEHQAVADLGVHHHTDAGALTVLLQDEVGGLQVFREGYWHDVPPTPGALVVNTGDMLQVWSNDRYRAAVHRVLAMERQDRYSIPFFFNPSARTEVSPLPSVVSASRPARYRPIRWSEFRYRRTDGDYADYGPEVQIAQYRI